MRATAIIACLLLTACGDSQEVKDHIAMWEGAVVVKICRSGKHIYRLRNGELRTNSYPVESTAVCE